MKYNYLSKFLLNNKGKKINTYKAFTLVELLVVVTILSVLATVGFIAYTSHLPGVRDAARIDQIGVVRSNLETLSLSKKLSLPDNAISIKVNGTTIGSQGYVGKQILKDIKMQDGGKDPGDHTYFTYYVSSNRKSFQLLTFLEEEQELSSFSKTYADEIDYEDRFPKIIGEKLGILTESGSNKPIQEVDTIITAGFLDIGTTVFSYTAHLSDTNKISGDSSDLISSNPKASCKRINETGNTDGNGSYKINPTGTQDIVVYCDMESDGGGWTLVGTLDNSVGYTSATWLDIAENIYGVSKISGIVDASISSAQLQGIRPTEFRWHPADDNNNLNLNNYFYIKPNYDINYTELFRNTMPVGGTTSKHTWYWTNNGGSTKWIGRTNLRNNALMYYRDSDGSPCSGPCGVFDFDVYTTGSSNLAQWARDGESWGTYTGRSNGYGAFSCAQDTLDTSYNVNFGTYAGKFCDGINSTNLTDSYSQGARGLGIFVR